MPKITAYKCPHTGRIFEHKREYTTHLRRLARFRARAQKEEAERADLETRWSEFRNAITSIDQLPGMILKHQDLFWETAAKKSSDFEICEITGVRPRLVEFLEFNLRFTEHVSNSHSCPIDGVINWGGLVKGAPRGYPGWSGRICWVVEWPRKCTGRYPGSNLLLGSRIHTGSGGGGQDLMRQNKECQSFGYGVEIFGTDWEVMYKTYRKNLFIKELKGEKR